MIRTGQRTSTWEAVKHRQTASVSDPAVSASRCKVPVRHPGHAEKGAGREGYLSKPARPMAVMSWAEAKTPIRQAWCGEADTDNAGILPLTQ